MGAAAMRARAAAPGRHRPHRPSSATAAILSRRAARGALYGACAALLLAACAAPVKIVRQSPRVVHRELTANALSTGRSSLPTKEVLTRRGLHPLWGNQPEAALAWLREVAISPSGDRDDLFALAELSFLYGERSGKREYDLAAALYAWAFLFPSDLQQAPDEWDPRLRLAADIYNRSVTMAFEPEEGASVDIRAGTYPLPWGALAVRVDEATLRWGDRTLVDFVAVQEFGIEGLENRYRRPGIGAPLAAGTTLSAAEEEAAEDVYIAKRVKVPVTALLRIDHPEEALVSKSPSATLELFPASGPDFTLIEGRRVPLEIEPSATLAYMLTEARLWDRELRAFLLGDLLGQEKLTRLAALEPHKPGRIPVILVHGTASSPARWADMVNELENDPRLRERYEFWMFSYDTGNPIPYSALLLRDSLDATVARLDPEGKDRCLRQMVVIGHSQGGLLTKMTAIESGDLLWRNLSRRPIEDMDLTPEERSLLTRGLFIHPTRSVSRVVFIATPHRGSYLAGGFINSLVAKLVSLPKNLVTLGPSLLQRNRSMLAQQDMERLPTAVDNMSGDDRFVRTLASMSTVPDVTANSIVAASGEHPLLEDTDGVVAYESAHREDVESELVVRSLHSTQSNPQTIQEVKRILLLHLSRVAEGGDCRPRAGAGAAPVPSAAPPR